MAEHLTISMTVACLKCRHVRMYARMQGGTATPMFYCPMKDLRHTHLMPGDAPYCVEIHIGNSADEDIIAETAVLEEHS